MRRRTGLCALAFALWLQGCGMSLDSFLYNRQRTSAYVFDPDCFEPGCVVTEERIERHWVTVDQQITLGAVRVLAPDAPLATLVFFHGNGPGLDGQFHHVKRLSNLGYDVFAFDYRGWGASTDVAPTEAGVHDDTRAALRYVVEELGADRERLVFYGHSFGTAAVSELAVDEPPAALVLEAPFASVAEFALDSTLLSVPYEYFAKDGWPTSTRITDIEAPLLVIVGLQDDYVRPEFGQRLHALHPGPKALVEVPYAKHEPLRELPQGEREALVNGFVSEHLP